MFSKVLVKFTTGSFTFLRHPLRLLHNLERHGKSMTTSMPPWPMSSPRMIRTNVHTLPPGPRVWKDVCVYTDYDNKPGACPAGTYCLDTFNANNERFINCVSGDEGKGKQKLNQSDPQIGSSDRIRARNQLANSQLEHSVTINHGHDWGRCGCCSQK